jgi:hypothetical protein
MSAEKYAVFANENAAYTMAESSAVTTPNLKDVELSAEVFSDTNFVIKNFMSHMHPPNLAAQRTKLKIPERNGTFIPAVNWLIKR